MTRQIDGTSASNVYPLFGEKGRDGGVDNEVKPESTPMDSVLDEVSAVISAKKAARFKAGLVGTVDRIKATLENESVLREKFQASFCDEAVDPERVARSLELFQKSGLSRRESIGFMDSYFKGEWPISTPAIRKALWLYIESFDSGEQAERA